MPSRTFTTVNMPPMSMLPNWPWPVIIGSVLGGRPMSIISPIPFWPIGDELNVASGARRNIHRRLPHSRRQRRRSGVSARLGKVDAMDVDGMAIHAQVREAHADALP